MADMIVACPILLQSRMVSNRDLTLSDTSMKTMLVITSAILLTIGIIVGGRSGPKCTIDRTFGLAFTLSK